MLVNLGTHFFGVLVFLFIFWKRQKEDYGSEVIFKSASAILIGVLVGYFLSKFTLKDAWFYFELLGGLAGVYISAYRLRMRFYEVLENFLFGVLPYLSFLYLKDAAINNSIYSFGSFVVTLSFILLFYLLELNYKNFSWYRSGKVGFAGLATAGTFFIVRSILAIFGITVLSFLNRFESIVSGVVAFICFLTIFNLSRQNK